MVIYYFDFQSIIKNKKNTPYRCKYTQKRLFFLDIKKIKIGRAIIKNVVFLQR